MAPSRFQRAASSLDMYRKVPIDLMEGTKRGSMLSYISLFTMLLLVFLETKDFLSRRPVTDLALDTKSDSKIRVNFNITMLDLRCDWAVIDIVSALGTDQNVSAFVNKWQLNADGVRQQFYRRNLHQDDVIIKDKTVTKTLQELHINGEDAVFLDEESLQYAKDENEYLFVDFFASWCSHCRDLAPTWEALAELMADAGAKLGNQHPGEVSESEYEEATKVELPVMVAKVDCVHQKHLCNFVEDIRAYPTLRLYVDGEAWKGGDYHGHRTLLDMVEWLYQVESFHKESMDDRDRQLHIVHEAARERIAGEEGSDEERQWHREQLEARAKKNKVWKDADHPGCLIEGHLLVDRTPGNFHVQARSKNQNILPHMTNTSHMVNKLSIGNPTVRKEIESGEATVPMAVKEKIAPLDGNVYVTNELHESYHHYLKLVATEVEGFMMGRRPARIHQILASSQLAYYQNDTVPEALFVYDLSPIAVTYRSESRHWYDYFTSLFAIVGGVFTVVGMLEATINTTMEIKRRRSAHGRR
eukprot:Nitzschia sp. Nitz4//scaffold127_size64804//44861//46626//NITZ4_006183-RA/size64804-augustus-gene-0.53-mRNA-1//1//CDS//3329534771//7617//frame0